MQEQPKVLPYKDLVALLAAHEKELRTKKRRLKTAPTDALQQEVELLTRQVQQMRNQSKFYLKQLVSGPREDLDALDLLLPRLCTLPFAWLFYIGVDVKRTPESVDLFLAATGSFALAPGLLPNMIDVLAMQFHRFEAKATHETLDGALSLAEKQIAEQMAKHPAFPTK
jgi:hypothetical protein